MTQETTYHSRINEDKKLFFRFLKEKGIYISYKKQFTISHIKKWKPDVGKTINSPKDFFNLSCGFYIAYAFDWDKTNEGFGYWSNLENVWIKTYNYYKHNTPTQCGSLDEISKIL